MTEKLGIGTSLRGFDNSIRSSRTAQLTIQVDLLKIHRNKGATSSQTFNHLCGGAGDKTLLMGKGDKMLFLDVVHLICHL